MCVIVWILTWVWVVKNMSLTLLYHFLYLKKTILIRSIILSWRWYAQPLPCIGFLGLLLLYPSFYSVNRIRSSIYMTLILLPHSRCIWPDCWDSGRGWNPFLLSGCLQQAVNSLNSSVSYPNTGTLELSAAVSLAQGWAVASFGY